MGNKCCAPVETKANKISTESQLPPPTTNTQMIKDTQMLLSQIIDSPAQIAEQQVQSSSQMTDQQSFPEINNTKSVQFSPPTTKKKEQLSTMTYLSHVKNQSADMHASNIQNQNNLERLEVPKLKPSPTIRISKEWMGQEIDDQLVESPLNVYKRERTMGSIKRPQNIELNINLMLNQQMTSNSNPNTNGSSQVQYRDQTGESPSKQNSGRASKGIMRKQSTIHQIKKRLERSKRQSGQSPNGSEFSVDYWNNKNNNSDLVSQNSLNSQSVSIQRHKQQQALLLDQLLLTNQLTGQGHLNNGKRFSNGNLIDELLSNSDPASREKRLQQLKKGMNAQTLGITLNNLSIINAAAAAAGNGDAFWFHSSTPQFQAESFMRGTSRSSCADEIYSAANFGRQDKDNEDLIHNLVDEPGSNSNSNGNNNGNNHLQSTLPQFGYYQGNMQNIYKVILVDRINLKPMSIGRDDDIYSKRDIEIVEDDNESQASSQDDRLNMRNVNFSRKLSSKKPSKRSKKTTTDKQEKVSKIDIENVENESNQDSFKSSLSMEEDENMNSDQKQVMISDTHSAEVTQRMVHNAQIHEPPKSIQSQNNSRFQSRKQSMARDGKKNEEIHQEDQTAKQKEEQIMQFVNQVAPQSKRSIQKRKNSNSTFDAEEMHQNQSHNQSQEINQSIQKIVSQDCSPVQINLPQINSQNSESPVIKSQMVQSFGHQQSLAIKLHATQQKNLISMIRQQKTLADNNNSPIKLPINNQSLAIQLHTTTPLDESKLRQQNTIISNPNRTLSNDQKGILTPLRSLSKRIKDDESLAKMKNILNQRKQDDAMKDLKLHIIQPIIEEREQSPMKEELKSSINDQYPKISLRMQASEEDELLDLSDMLGYTQECITPSEFTPMSALDNQTTSAAWFNPDVSLDYSTLHIEYLAENQEPKTQHQQPEIQSIKQNETKDRTTSRQSSKVNNNQASRLIRNFKQNTSFEQHRNFKVRDFNTDNHAKTPKVNHNIQSMFENKRDARLSNYQANSMSLHLQENSILQKQITNELTRENLKKLEGDTKQDLSQFIFISDMKSMDGTPKSQVTRSVISGRDQKGKRKINQYIVLSELGRYLSNTNNQFNRGSYAEVFLCVNEETKQRFAMKILNKRKLNRIFISKTRTALQNVEKEIAIMKKLDHPNVVQLIEVLDDPTHDKLYIIMEYLPNGTLMKKLSKTKNSNLQLIWKYFRDLILGLNYLHESAGVIHRDIKPDNLLIDEQDRLKISDFGVSFLMENGSDEITTTAGSNYYLAPEVCQGTTFKGRKSDIWAAGITLYQMVFKKYPFISNMIPDLYNKIQTKEVTLLEIMNHDWVTSNGILPMPRIIYPKVEVTQGDTANLFKNVWMISKIKLKFRNQIQAARKKQTFQQNRDVIQSNKINE
ncbi:protein kinase domain containing protein [Stylonychia lemnae]|uniref:Protein kinase domain containing protein n=1 Tax=Stylonychia lemnae TaxID=5949 RepID=A0A078AT70_STYLE|nr:protein kinase domain containing protein [Stylonychia lemnae]|eukprot:CDW85374.1 protein kinase domain containing protein [Stylonychia lemnae]